MKNRFLIKFKYKIFAGIVFRILLYSIIMAVILFLVDNVLSYPIASLISNINRSFYIFLVRNKELVIYLLFIVIIFLSVNVSINKTIKCLNTIILSIDKVFKKDESLVKLPNGFKDIEVKLNSIKYEGLRNEHVAREAEQRKNDLVVYLAHDLKTPLTSVIGYLSLLHDEKSITDELRDKYISISLEKAQRLEDLINEFFEITRFNLQNISIDYIKFNLSLMLNQLTDEFYPLLSDKNLNFKLNVPPDIIIKGDSDKLARVFDNILRNAINYSYENSEIEITAEYKNSNVELSFKNPGNKIPEQQLNHIFEKFYRLDTSRSSKTGGAGLGLAIAKEIIELHGGTISVFSNDQYTQFLISLPNKM